MNFRTTHKRRLDHARPRIRVTAPAWTSGSDRRPRNIRALRVRAPELQRAAALSGLIAFVTFNLGWILGDFAQRPAFSPAHADISHLGAMTAKSPWLHNQVASNLTGLLIVALAVGVWLALSPSRIGRLGAATLAAMGVGLFLDGFLRLDCQPIDAGCSNDSWLSHAHKINSGFLNVFSFVSVLLLALAFRRLPRWRGWWLPLLATIPASFIAGLAFSSLGSGAAQRAANVGAMAAVAIIAFGLFQHANEAQRRSRNEPSLTNGIDGSKDRSRVASGPERAGGPETDRGRRGLGEPRHR